MDLNAKVVTNVEGYMVRKMDTYSISDHLSRSDKNSHLLNIFFFLGSACMYPCRKPASVTQLDARLTDDQEIAGSAPTDLQHSF